MHTFFVFLLSCLPLLAWSQSALEVRLQGPDGKAIPNQSLSLENPQLGFSQTQSTDDQGKIQFFGLAPGQGYVIKIEAAQGWQAYESPPIHLISDKQQSLQIQLQALTAELAEVVFQSSSINRTDGQVAAELSRAELQVLPVEGRDMSRALYRLPNIAQATGFFPEAPNVSINGANSLYTNYQIDGLDNNENFLGGQRFAMPFGFTENITALTNNFSAEHGWSSNGIINLSSRSGSNKLEIEAFYLTRPGSILDAPSPFAQRDLSGNQVKDGFMRQQGGFAFGLPLKKDRRFLFVNFEHTTDFKDNLLNIPQLGINQTVQGQNKFNYFSFKLDEHWSAHWRSSLRFNLGLVSIERQGGGLEGGNTLPSAGNAQERNSQNLALKNSYTKGHFGYESNFLLARFHWNYAQAKNSSSPSVTVLDPQGLSLAFLGHPGYQFNELEQTAQIQQKFRYQAGKHYLKFGGQWKASQFSLIGGGNPNGSYTIQLDQAQLDALRQSGKGVNLLPSDLPSDAQVLYYGVELRPQAFQKNQQLWSLYLEDQWSVNERLSLNLGLRYDYDNLSKGGGKKGDFNNLAPRVSANYQLGQRTSLRAGYGIYYDKILYAIYSDALQFNTTSADYRRQISALVSLGLLPSDTDVQAVTHEGNLTASAVGVSYLQGPSAASLQEQRDRVFSNELRILNPNGYQNPYSHQIMLGLQHQAKENLWFYVDLMHNRSYNLFRLRNLNAPSSFVLHPDSTTVRSAAEADASRPMPLFNDANGPYMLWQGDTLRGIARNVVMTETAGRSNYYAANFTLHKQRGEDRYAFRLIYTLSYLENNTEDINFRAVNNNDFEAEWGPSINDRRHIINGMFTYYPWRGAWSSVASLLQSGQPINRIPDARIYGTTDLNGDGLSFSDAYVGNNDRHPGEARNSDRLPWAVTFDLNLGYEFKLKNEHRLQVTADIFNVFNAQNFSGYSNNATQSNQIQVGSAASGVLVRRNAAPPRQFQFGLRYLLY